MRLVRKVIIDCEATLTFTPSKFASSTLLIFIYFILTYLIYRDATIMLTLIKIYCELQLTKVLNVDRHSFVSFICD